jgi:hypothetical protein
MEFSACGDHGDIVYEMSALAQAPGGPHELYLVPQPGRTRLTMTPDHAEGILPLLRRQPYLRAVEYSEAVRGRPLWGWRESGRGWLNLADRACESLGLPHYPRGRPWLFNVTPRRVAGVVVNLTSRYRNGRIDWKKVVSHYRPDVVFVGHHDEFFDFVAHCGPLSYRHCPDLLAVAEVIAGGGLFLGNQSCCYALATALGRRAGLERATGPDDNCHFDRPGAWYWYDHPADLPSP